MRLNLIDIINNKLHNFKYLNFTIAFYVTFFYTYYSLFVYLFDKNYIMLLLYFIFFILLYSSYKNFTYFLGFAVLIIFKIFNIDTIVNTSSINLVKKFNINKIENLDLMDKIQKKADAKGDELKKNAKDNNPPPNPCKSYIINKLQEVGIKISDKKYNHEAKKNGTESEINNIMAGHHDVERPIIYSHN
jgi:hypothetical protein